MIPAEHSQNALCIRLRRERERRQIALASISANTKISASLFEPSYTIASVIANEFTEATGDLYLSALIQIGLILFFVTFLVNGVAKLLVWSVTRGTSGTARAA